MSDDDLGYVEPPPLYGDEKNEKVLDYFVPHHVLSQLFEILETEYKIKEEEIKNKLIDRLFKEGKG